MAANSTRHQRATSLLRRAGETHGIGEDSILSIAFVVRHWRREKDGTIAGTLGEFRVRYSKKEAGLRIEDQRGNIMQAMSLSDLHLLSSDDRARRLEKKLRRLVRA